jgi:uncharacterized protein (TIGR03437 family)
MTRTFTSFLLAGAFACSVSAQPVVTMVVNRTSYSAVVSPGSGVIIVGYNFASSPQSAPAGSLPTTLGGVSVNVGGLPASLLSVSPDEIDALIPSQTAIPQNTVVPLAVTAASGSVTYNLENSTAGRASMDSDRQPSCRRRFSIHLPAQSPSRTLARPVVRNPAF